jgi:Ca-activated chloride channel family protein
MATPIVKTNRLLSSLLLLLLIVACSSSTKPPLQAGSGSVSGVVVDHGGTFLPGVTVTLRTASGDRTAVTDGQGRYTFARVPAGHHQIVATLSGFNPAMYRVSVKEETITRADAVLTIGATETITVAAEAPAMEKTRVATNVALTGNVVGGVVGGTVGGLVSAAIASPPPNVSMMAQRVDAMQSTANYAPIAEHDFATTAKDRVTTFSIDVDGASYANVRRFLTANLVPPPNAVRIEEMVNYFTYHYPEPRDGRPVAIDAEVAGCPWEPSHRLMRVGLKAKSVEAWKQAPNNLVFLLDVSGSMAPPERLPLVTQAMRLLVDQLRPVDSVAIVVYAGASGLALPHTPASDKQTIYAALGRLQAGGSTAGGAGVELAYKTAQDNFVAGGNNRVILATDGDFNVGVTDIKALTALIEEKRKSGIYLTCVGVGTQNLNDALMESLADKGNGNYYYLDGLAEAKKVFVNQLTGTLLAVADDVKVQIDFNRAAVASYRQVGYENRALANEDFTDDNKDAGELGSGQQVTALYELVPAAGFSRGNIATVKLRYKEPGAKSSQEIAAAVNDDGKSAYAATPDTQFAAAVAELGMLLRNSKHKGIATFADVAALARAMRGEDVEGYREELIRMVESSKMLAGPERVASQ